MQPCPVPPSQAAAHYLEQGYVHVPQVVDPVRLDRFRDRIARAVDDLARERQAAGAISDLHAGASLEHRLLRITQGKELGRSWDGAAFSPELHALITDPGVLGSLQPILGDDLVFDGDFHLRPKLPDSALTAFPWHQDSQYYGPGTEHMHTVTVWIPLVDVNEANGCLWLIPGSQHWGLQDGARGADLNIRTFADVEARGTPRPLPMRRGDILLFSNLTMHASQVNRSDHVRWSLDLRYSAFPAADMSTREREARRLRYGKLAAGGMPGFRASGPQGTEPFPVWETRRQTAGDVRDQQTFTTYTKESSS